MRKTILSFIALFFAMSNYAQTSLVATLTHGDSISMYYGSYALRDAHDAAKNGDVINLSGGTFQSVKITKAISIRGTGINDSNPTYIVGDFVIEISPEITERLSFEGCRITNAIYPLGTLSNAYFAKTSIGSIINGSDVNMVNGVFANCNIFKMTLDGKSTVQIVNSHIERFDINGDEAVAYFANCDIFSPYYNPWFSYIENLHRCQLINCIIFTNDVDGFRNFKIPSTATALNCIAASPSVNLPSDGIFDNLLSKQNCTNTTLDVFTDSDYWKELTDEAKTKYLGNDGTVVGMYGGVLPYDMTPFYPRITKMNVAKRTTADGKLSVEIEVSAAQ